MGPRVHCISRQARQAIANAAKREVYKETDLNGDGRLDHDEASVASLYDFYKADVNHDRTLSQDEFIGEYRILKLSRSASE